MPYKPSRQTLAKLTESPLTGKSFPIASDPLLTRPIAAETHSSAGKLAHAFGDRRLSRDHEKQARAAAVPWPAIKAPTAV